MAFTDLLFLNTFGWFKELNSRESANLQAFMRFIGYAEGTNGYWRSDLSGDKGWKTVQKYGLLKNINKHPEGCSATGKAVGWFQIEGKSWCDLGYNGKPLSKENQVEWFIQTVKKCFSVYDRGRGVALDGTYYRIIPGVSETSAYTDILRGHFYYALLKTRGKWKSIPGGKPGLTKSMRERRWSRLVDCIPDIIRFGGVYVKESKSYTDMHKYR